MATRTTAQAGPWSTGATWVGGVAPGSGDNAVIDHTVTVSVNQTVGTSPNDNTTLAIEIQDGGSLTINDGVTLTVKGNVEVTGFSFAGQTIGLGAGSVWEFDASGSGGTPVYKLTATFIRLRSLGTSVSRSAFRSVVGHTCAVVGSQLFHGSANAVDWNYTDFTRVSTLTLPTNTTGGIKIDHCTFTSCGLVNLSCSGAESNGVAVTDNKWASSTHADYSLELQFTVTPTASRTCLRNAMDKGLFDAGSLGFRYDLNVFGSAGGTPGLEVTTGASWTGFRRNLIVGNGTSNNNDGMILPGSSIRNYWFIETEANPHYTAPEALGADDNTVEQSVFEGYADSTFDAGDAILVNADCTSGGNKVIGRNNIVLPLSKPATSGTSGCLLTIFANDDAVTEFTRNTVCVTVVNNDKRGALAVAEGSDGSADQVEVAGGNLIWGGSANQGYLGERVSGTVKDHFTPAGCNKNWVWNTSAGDNLRSFESRVGSGDMWTGGNAVAAGVDANQGSGDPGFVNVGANLAAWAVARGYGTDYQDAIDSCYDDVTLIPDLIDFTFEKFKTQTAGCRNFSPDGMCVGAANWDNPDRSLTRIDSIDANVLATYGF